MKRLRPQSFLAGAAGIFLSGLCVLNAQSAEEQWVDALEKLAHPLNAAQDLDPALQAMGDARLVLLGEASHGTSEFYTWRAKISRRLIAEKGFSFIVVEGDWASLHRLNRYVKGLDNSDARDVLRRFDRWPLWMWANEEVAELAEWLRDYNKERAPAGRVGFYGMDVYGWESSIAEVVRYLQDNAPDLAREVRSLYSGLARHQGDVGSYVRAAAAGDSSEAEAGKVVELLREHRQKLSAADGDAFFVAKQNAWVVKSAEAHLRKMARQGPDSWNARVRHMKDTVARLKEFYGEESRGIVWAHNTHIGDARATAMAAHQQINIGQLARQRWGEDAVFLLGFSTHRGEVLAGRSWGAPRATLRVPHAQAGSIEALLNQLDADPALLVFRGNPIAPALRQVRGHRAMGVIYHPERESGNYVPTILPQRYDALIFLAETTPLRPLHTQ